MTVNAKGRSHQSQSDVEVQASGDLKMSADGNVSRDRGPQDGGDRERLPKGAATTVEWPGRGEEASPVSLAGTRSSVRREVGGVRVPVRP